MKPLIILLTIFLLPLFCKADWKFVAELGHGGRISSIAVPDSSNCYLLDQSYDLNYIYKTSDQGKTFVQIYKNSISDSTSLYLYDANQLVSPNPNYLYLVFNNRGEIKKSRDGGYTFERIKLSDSTIVRMAMRDTNVGIAIGTFIQYDFCYITDDGWKTFKKLDTLFVGGLYTPIFVDSNNVQILYLINTREALLNYNIKTGVWSILHDFTDSPDTFNRLTYVNNYLGFLVGSRHTGNGDQSADIIYRTKDGGKNWEKIYDKENIPIFGLQDIAFYDKNNGVADGDGNKILITNDGGDTWIYERPETMNRGYDTIYGSLVSRVAWVGKTPVIGTFGGNFYRYEGDFFKFDDSIVTTVTPATLKLPENGAIAQNTGLMMQWNNFSDQYNLIVEIAKDSQFVNIITSKIKNPASPKFNSFIYDGLENFTTYYWRVGYILTDPDDTVWSETFHFRTKIEDSKISNPKCGSIDQNTDVILNWNLITGADYYRLEYGKDENLESSIIKIDSLVQPQYSAQSLDSGTTYYWRAKAFNQDEENEWTPICFFKTVDPKSDVREEIPGGTVSISQSDDMLLVKVESDISAEYRLEIFDFSGNSIFNDQLNESVNIDLAHYASGVYFYKISRAGEIINTGKFTVVR